MTIKRALLLGGVCVALSFNAPQAPAADVAGMKLPDQVNVQGKSLKLNGTGLRQATILKINVYAAGLYLENPSKDGEAIANSDQPKAIEMVFLRDVTAKQMADAFQEGFDKNCVADCARLKPDLAKLQGFLKDMKKGETMGIRFLSEGVDVMIRGAKAGSAGDKAFSHQLIRCWIGKNPANPGLKSGLLGSK